MFNLYFAGVKKECWDIAVDKKCCRLYSYCNERKLIEQALQDKQRGPLLIDSGAFSVAHSNKKVNIDEYIEYINSHDEIENFIELDVIPFPVLNIETAKDCGEKSWQNYLYMIERLNHPEKLLPVFHFGEPFEYLKRILEYKINGKTPIPFICIGGRHGVDIKIQCEYFDKIFNVIKNSSNPNVKVHVLGMTHLPTLEKYPFYSADSTTYLKSSVYGHILTKYGELYNGKKLTKNNLTVIHEKEQTEVSETVKRLGFTLEELRDDRIKNIRYNMLYTLDWCENYELKHTPKIKKQLF